MKQCNCPVHGHLTKYKYVIVDARSGKTVTRLRNAEEVTAFLWGRCINNYSIYQLQGFLDANMMHTKTVLERRELAQIMYV